MTYRNMLRSVRLFCLVALLAGLFAGRAQAQIGLYAMGSGGHYSGPGVQNGAMTAWGGTFGAYEDFLRIGPMKLGTDGRFLIQNSGNSTPYGKKLLGGLFGLRLDASIPAIPFRPYVQGEVGGVGSNNGTSRSKDVGFAYQVQGGLDFTLFPRLDARGEIGTGQVTGVTGGSHTLTEFGVGIVLRL
jgi:hypothetical protein